MLACAGAEGEPQAWLEPTMWFLKVSAVSVKNRSPKVLREATTTCVLCPLLVCGLEAGQSSLELGWGQEHILCPG